MIKVSLLSIVLVVESVWACGSVGVWAKALSYTVTPESLVFLRRFVRVVASNLKPDTKFTKNAKRTKNAEGHEEGWPYFVFFLPFFVAFVPFPPQAD